MAWEPRRPPSSAEYHCEIVSTDSCMGLSDIRSYVKLDGILSLTMQDILILQQDAEGL